VLDAFQAVPKDALLALILLLWPLVVLVHEAAHAAAAMLVSRTPVEIVFGRRSEGLRVRAGRLHMSVDVPGIWLCAGRIRWQSTRRLRDGVVVVAGPLASLATGCGAAIIAVSAEPASHTAQWGVVFAVESLASAAFTLAPIARLRTDGHALLVFWRYHRARRRASVPPPR
jgi:hypothetical protein